MNPRSDRVRRAYNLHLLDGFGVDGATGMPVLDPADASPRRLRAFTSCPRCSDGAAGVHFFLDDYRFEGVWSDPVRYVPMLSRFGCVLTPDFSCYLDMPEPMQRWNVYRSRAVGRIWQDAGLRVVPALTWGDPGTYAFCFDGVPRGSTVALSTVGLMDCAEGIGLFRNGAEEAARRLRPSRVLAYGRECGFDACGAEVLWYGSEMQSRFDAIRERKKKEKDRRKGR
ncbi:DUF4417 domain-containing protein [Raoultibacter massiliensis]|uniref:DUF4417 domain-containing protein n=1 Tax=Raoultibacter massiliensis TaxID=1852371 RepID=UPI003A8E5718